MRGLLGPTGAGKTTLLRLLFGLMSLDAGSIELLGRPLVRLGGPAERGGRTGSAGLTTEQCCRATRGQLAGGACSPLDAENRSGHPAGLAIATRCAGS